MSQSPGRRRIRDQIGVTLPSKMNSNKVKKSRDTSPPATPITIQVQVRLGVSSSSTCHVSTRVEVPGGSDPAVTNSHLLPQQDCPVFTGDCVMNGAFKKISNAV